MVNKKRSLAIRAGLILLGIMLFLTFFAETIGSFLTPKVTTALVRQGILNRELSFREPELFFEDAFEVKLPEAADMWLTVAEVYAQKGDVVSAGDVILSFDVSPLREALNAQTAELAGREDALYQFDVRLEEERLRLLRQIEDDREALSVLNPGDTTILSPGGGLVTAVYVKNGDMLQKGSPLADVVDTARMCLTLPFLSAHAENIRVGMSAEVVVSAWSATLPGVVERVYTGKQVSVTGAIVTDVEISLQNPGALREGDLALATVAGGYTSVNSASLSFAESFSMLAEAGGELSGFTLKSGDSVSPGQALGLLSSGAADTQAVRLREDITRREASLAYLLENETLNGQARRSLLDALEKARLRQEALSAAIDECLAVKTGADGFIWEMGVSAGQALMGGDALFAVVGADAAPRLRIPMTQNEASAVKAGNYASAEYVISDGKSQSLKPSSTPVVIESIAAQNDAARPYAALAAFREDLPRGAAVISVRFELPQQAGLLIPLSALIDETSVYIALQKETFLGKELRVERREVRLGEKSVSQAIVSEGVDANEYVITSWDRPIQDGQRVLLPNE